MRGWYFLLAYGCPRNAPTRLSGSIRSQNILKVARRGTASRVPTTPQRYDQRRKVSRMATGFKVNQRPRKSGVARLPSIIEQRRYARGGKTAYQAESK